MSRDTLGPRRVVRAGRYEVDPALDLGRMNIQIYRVTRSELDLAYHEGKGPEDATWFYVARLKNRFVTEALDSLDTMAQRFERAFCAAVQRIEVPGEGVMVPDPEQMIEWRAGGKGAGTEWVDRVADRFGRGTVQEMGSVAYDHANLAAGADGPFALPPGVGPRR